MTPIRLALLLSLAFTLAADAQGGRKPFPAHWGEPPKIQTTDFGDLPGGYGKGSSTLAKWIESNLEKDRKSPAPANPAADAAVKPVYENNFQNNDGEKMPTEFLVLGGDFAVKEDGGNRFLELPGAPLLEESCGVLFGPTESDGICVQARVFGTRTGRRFPAMGVGLNGYAGYRLQIVPAKNLLELSRTIDGEERVIASAPFEWQSGAWTVLRLQVRKEKANTWRVEGKAWPQTAKEPATWQINHEDVAKDAEKESPRQGRPAIWGKPYSGTPIRFDDLLITRVK